MLVVHAGKREWGRKFQGVLLHYCTVYALLYLSWWSIDMVFYLLNGLLNVFQPMLHRHITHYRHFRCHQLCKEGLSNEDPSSGVNAEKRKSSFTPLLQQEVGSWLACYHDYWQPLDKKLITLFCLAIWVSMAVVKLWGKKLSEHNEICPHITVSLS